MKVKGLDGRIHTWKLGGHVPTKDAVENRSSYHLAARELLTKLFPMDRVLEEVHLPGANDLFLDFFIPGKRLAVEVHGEQHYRFISHFHQTMFGFIASKRRDTNKRNWCSLNDIELVELPYTENVDEWRKRIEGSPSATCEYRESS